MKPHNGTTGFEKSNRRGAISFGFHQTATKQKVDHPGQATMGQANFAKQQKMDVLKISRVVTSRSSVGPRDGADPHNDE